MPTIVFLRHGETLWTSNNLFCGWEDVDLSPKGNQEAIEAGKRMKAHGLSIDVAYTSVLKRAIKTLWLVLDVLDEVYIPVHHTWKLNERMYGALTGLNKSECARIYGEAQVKTMETVIYSSTTETIPK